jgi:hypothetical protein
MASVRDDSSMGWRQYRLTPVRDNVIMRRCGVDIAGIRKTAGMAREAFVGSRPDPYHTDGVIPNGAGFQAERGISKSTDL